MGSNQGRASRQTGRSRTDGGRQSAVHQCVAVDRQNGSSVAGLARTVRKMELGFSEVQSTVQTSRLGSNPRNLSRSRSRVFDVRFDSRSRSPTCGGRKKRGPEEEALG